MVDSAPDPAWADDASFEDEPGGGEPGPAPGTEDLPSAVPAIMAEPDGVPTFDFDGFAVQNEIHLIAGDGGAGKTSLLTAILAAQAAECAALDRFPNRRTGSVLLISEEDSEGLLRNRLEALCVGHGWPAAQVLARVHLLCFGEVRIDQAHWQQHLLSEVERIGAVAVGLDPWFELIGGEENSNTQVRPAIQFLRKLALLATVYVVAHAGKAVEGKRTIDRIRGASALYSAARVVYFAEVDERGVAVRPVKFSRAELPKRFVVSRQTETDPENRLVWTSARLSYLTADEAQEVGAERLVREALTKAPGSKSTEIKAYAKGSGIPAVEISAAIKSLERKGVIAFDPGPNNAKLWSLIGQNGRPAENSSAGSAGLLAGLPEPAGQAGEAPRKPASSYRRQAEVGADGQADPELPF